MNQITFESSQWYDAATLSERVSGFQAHGERPENQTLDDDSSQRRLGRWRSQPPFDSDSLLEDRLALDGITPVELGSLLGETVQEVKARFEQTPVWLDDLEQAYRNMSDASPSEIHSDFHYGSTAGFIRAFAPLIRLARARIEKGVRTLLSDNDAVPVSGDYIAEILLAGLAEQLLSIAGRTLILELNVARLEGQLEGETTEVRFEAFTTLLTEPDFMLRLLHRYPVLARQLTTTVEHWVRFSLEILEHFCVDWPDIKSTFQLTDSVGLIVRIESGLGDNHQDGRSVRVFGFSSGLQIVYKPRSQAVAVHFQEFLVWLNSRIAQPHFRTLRVLDKEHTAGLSLFVKRSVTPSAE